MTKRLLIDARQSEETRVVLLSGTRIEDFDYETENRKQLKGNVYLARVTRVEPSLQAAFVEYGGNRQGFLAFSEIHPDYYRIPVEDREALVAAERENAEDEDRDEDGEGRPETLGGEDDEDEDIRPKRQTRKYKIQEVISRKQIMLVQVVKEERGNKGAALTTYLSLAGRYCVLMPNSTRRGGVSRKITNAADRKRLKTIVGGLDVQDGTAVIVRTAGAKRTKPEISRDYAYLSKLWDEIRTKTLESQAPSLIHEEGDLIKRSIRDLYTSEVDEVIVEGEDGYKVARQQMKMLIPSHVKYEEEQPIFQRYQVEQQMDTIHSPQVTLKSGGYLVINQTEALVAIDVNSGRSTRERNIEETALKTNLEAAEELARQLRLRDLSGLIVVDFIDMEENRNQTAVERRLKDAMRNDRARIQIGSISHFGLLEMSRQRLRISFNESITSMCPHCEGTGRVRSVETAALQMLRVIEDEAMKGKMDELRITMHRDVALYILNHKREVISGIEERLGLRIIVLAGDNMIATEHEVERIGWQGKKQRKQERPQRKDSPAAASADEDEDEDEDEAVETVAAAEDDEDEQPKRRKRGRRGGRRRRRRGADSGDAANAGEAGEASSAANDDEIADADAAAETPVAATAKEAGSEETEAKPKSRRSRGRGKKSAATVAVEAVAESEAVTRDETSDAALAGDDTPVADASPDDTAAGEAPKKRTRKKAAKKAEPESESGDAGEAIEAAEATETAEAPAKKTRKKAAKSAGTTKKKAAKKAAKAKAAPKAKSAPADEAGNVASSSGGSEAGNDDSDARAPISSAPQDVIEVGSSDPAKRRTGWWNRG
jgi:ribonuclease E